MRTYDNIEVFDVYRAMELHAVYEELSAITVNGFDVEPHYIASIDPLERVLMGHDIFGDAKA